MDKIQCLLKIFSPDVLARFGHYIDPFGAFWDEIYPLVKQIVEREHTIKVARMDVMYGISTQIEKFGGFVYGGFPRDLYRYIATKKITAINPFSDIDIVFNKKDQIIALLEFLNTSYAGKIYLVEGDATNLLDSVSMREIKKIISCIDSSIKYASCLKIVLCDAVFDIIPEDITIRLDINYKPGMLHLDDPDSTFRVDCDINALYLKNDNIHLIKCLKKHLCKKDVLNNIEQGKAIALFDNKPIIRHGPEIYYQQYQHNVYVPSTSEIIGCNHSGKTYRYKKMSSRGYTFLNKCINRRCCFYRRTTINRKHFCVGNGFVHNSHEPVSDIDLMGMSNSENESCVQCISVFDDLASIRTTISTIDYFEKKGFVRATQVCRNSHCLMSKYFLGNEKLTTWNVYHKLVFYMASKCDLSGNPIVDLRYRTDVDNPICDDKKDNHKQKMRSKRMDIRHNKKKHYIKTGSRRGEKLAK